MDCYNYLYKEDTRAFYLPAMSSHMEILFLGEKPEYLWHYTQLPLYERPGQPHHENRLALTGGSAVSAEWKDLYGGLFSGIAWKWKSN